MQAVVKERFSVYFVGFCYVDFLGAFTGKYFFSPFFGGKVGELFWGGGRGEPDNDMRIG